MKLGELIEKLSALVEADGYRKDMLVAFSPEESDDVHPVNGGIIQRDKATGLSVLLLAPIALPDVGGF